VRKGRKTIDEQKMAELSDGRVFTAEQALQQGLIDKVGYLDEGIEWAKEMAGVKKSRVVIYHRPSNYITNAYSLAAASADGIGPLVNLELPDWLDSGGAQFLYLWQPAANNAKAPASSSACANPLRPECNRMGCTPTTRHSERSEDRVHCTQFSKLAGNDHPTPWIPAFAGMTIPRFIKACKVCKMYFAHAYK
jgi:hypothetical protein